MKKEIGEFLKGTWNEIALEIMDNGQWRPCAGYTGGEVCWKFLGRERESADGRRDYFGEVKMWDRGVLWHEGDYRYDTENQELQVKWQDGKRSHHTRYRLEINAEGDFWVYPVEETADPPDGEIRMRFRRRN